MIVTPAEMRAIEEAAFARGDGTTPESLMKKVGDKLARRLLSLSSYGANVLVYVGRGNNAGDALVAAARYHKIASDLQRGQRRYRVALRLATDESALGPLPQKMLAALPATVPPVESLPTTK